ncbi:MAG: type IV secretion protein IcmT [Alphaproteobacteria bacterium]|nr:type IV secretion protein IcmT [Alphaproteobacteria bacterium]
MSKAVEELREQLNWHWRNSMRPIKFFGLDAKAAIPFLVLIVYFRPITLGIAFLVTMIFWTLEKRGLTVEAAMRKLRSWLVGEDRPGLMQFKHRRFRDFG